MCFCKYELTEKAEPCFLQECACMWFFKEELTENPDRQISQENGFSPLCVLIWLFNVDLKENADPQTSQKMVSLLSEFAYGFLNWNS